NTVAGNNGDGSGYSGDSGPAVAGQLSSPIGVTVDKSGNIFISDQNNNVVREVTKDGNINTVAGNQPTPGYGGDGGSALGANAAFLTPAGIGIDGSGNLYVADLGNDVIRKFSVNGNISTVAGNNLLYLQGPNGLATGGFS